MQEEKQTSTAQPYDKAFFVSDCKKFYMNAIHWLEVLGFPAVLTQHPVDIDRPGCLVDTNLWYLENTIKKAKEELAGQWTQQSIFINVKRGVMKHESGVHTENVHVLVVHGETSVYRVSRGATIPDSCVETAWSNTPQDYPHRARGFKGKINDVVKAAYPDVVTDVWNWANNDKFGHVDFGLEGKNTIRAALFSLFSTWNRSNTTIFLCKWSLLLKESLDWVAEQITNSQTAKVKETKRPIVACGPQSALWTSGLALKLNTTVQAAGSESPEQGVIYFLCGNETHPQNAKNSLIVNLGGNAPTVSGDCQQIIL